VSRFAFVAAERANHAVATLCRIIGASVSGFYAWLRAIPATRAEAEAELRRHIGRVFAAGRRVYGSPRIHAELRREGRRHSRRRVARLMREMGLSARRGRRRPPRTTDSRHDLPVAPNLLDRHFDADRPDTVWLADISEILLAKSPERNRCGKICSHHGAKLDENRTSTLNNSTIMHSVG
jgi:transposase InsO family protein